MGERGEEQLVAALGRKEEEKSRVGLGEQGTRAGISQGMSGVGRARRVCWQMPCKVYIPHCLFTWRKFPAAYIQGAGS